MKWFSAGLITSLFVLFTGCSHASDENGGSGQYVERASPVLYQTITKKGGSSVTFLLGARWSNSCGQYARAAVSLDSNVYSITVFGKEPKGAVCLQVMSTFTALLTIELPAPGRYRFRFWQSDSTAIDTTFVTK